MELVYWEQYEEKSQALKREYPIKQLTRKQKQQLIGRSVHAEKEHALS